MIDLHTHSTVSDGSDPPDRVVELAAGAGCSAVALTDHDRLDGIAAASHRGQELGVEVVGGCELSCEWDPGTFHLLVYFVEPGQGELEDVLAELQRVRDGRNDVMVERLTALGLPITMAEVEKEAGGVGIGRPHMAAVLVANGAADSVNDAFAKWLAKGRPGYVPRARLAPAEAIRLARSAGGVPVMAHPLSLELAPADLDRTVGELAGLGLGGIEALYGRYSPEERQGLADLAKGHGLVATGGSDHHGTYKPDLSVGVGRGDLCVPDSVLEDLAAARV